VLYKLPGEAIFLQFLNLNNLDDLYNSKCLKQNDNLRLFLKDEYRDEVAICSSFIAFLSKIDQEIRLNILKFDIYNRKISIDHFELESHVFYYSNIPSNLDLFIKCCLCFTGDEVKLVTQTHYKIDVRELEIRHDHKDAKH
jgi:hypothetical protein